MKFDITGPQPIPDIDYTLRVGNVYPSKNTRFTKYWVVVSLHNGSAHMLGIDKDGQITSTVSYGQHVFNGEHKNFQRSLDLVGTCDDIANLNLNITWL